MPETKAQVHRALLLFGHCTSWDTTKKLRGHWASFSFISI